MLEVTQELQYFWRCAHHTSAIDNFFAGRGACERGCHLTPLQSSDSGYHRQPKSEGRRRGMHDITDQIFGP